MQRGLEDDPREGPLLIGEAGQSQVGRLLAHLVAGLGDGRNRWGKNVEPFGESQLAGDKANALMSIADQMFDGRARAGNIGGL